MLARFAVYCFKMLLKWIDHIFPLETAEEVREFVKLWEAISSVQLNDLLEDELRWRILRQECLPHPVR